MKLINRWPLLMATAAVLIFTSCSKTNEAGKLIPKNAALVVLVDGASLSSKLPWEDVKNNEWFKKLYSDSTVDAYIKTALDNPDNTGIDSKKDFLFFVQKDSLGGYVGMEGEVKDAAKFKQFYGNIVKGAVEKEKDGVKYLSNNQITASWKGNKFILLVDAPQINDMNKYSNSADDNMLKRKSVTRDGAAVALQLFGLKEKSSLAKEDKFTELLDQKGDVHFWFNMEEFSGDVATMRALQMVNLQKLYEGSITTATANFENGRIDFDMKSYTNKEMAKLWKKYEGKKADTEMMKRYAGKDVAVMLAFNFKPEGIREFIKILGMEGLVNMGTGFLGFSMDDFINANKGDVFFSLSDITVDTSRGYSRPKMNGMFAATVGDKKAFGKLIDAGNKMGKFGGPDDIYFNTSEKYFAIGNNKEYVNKFTGKGADNKFAFIDKISGSPMAGYINIQYLLQSFKSEMTRDSLSMQIYDASLKMWETAIVKGGEFKDGGTVQHMEINLVDKNTNSLKQLNTYLSLVGKIQKERDEKNRREYSEMITAPVEEPVVADTIK